MSQTGRNFPVPAGLETGSASLFLHPKVQDLTEVVSLAGYTSLTVAGTAIDMATDVGIIRMITRVLCLRRSGCVSSGLGSDAFS